MYDRIPKRVWEHREVAKQLREEKIGTLKQIVESGGEEKHKKVTKINSTLITVQKLCIYLVNISIFLYYSISNKELLRNLFILLFPKLARLVGLETILKSTVSVNIPTPSNKKMKAAF